MNGICKLLVDAIHTHLLKDKYENVQFLQEVKTITYAKLLWFSNIYFVVGARAHVTQSSSILMQRKNALNSNEPTYCGSAEIVAATISYETWLKLAIVNVGYFFWEKLSKEKQSDSFTWDFMRWVQWLLISNFDGKNWENSKMEKRVAISQEQKIEIGNIVLSLIGRQKNVSNFTH